MTTTYKTVYDTEFLKKTRLFLFFMLMAGLAGFSTGATYGAFTASATIPGNSLSAGTWNDDPPADSELFAVADTYLRSGAQNTNEGASPFLRIRASGDNRALVRFDQGTIETAVGSSTLIAALLVLEMDDNKDNWGNDGGTLSAYRVTKAWEEGNGKAAEVSPTFGGSIPGATWNCAIDPNTANGMADGCSTWSGGSFVGSPTDTQIIVNGAAGTLSFDVTADVQAFLDSSADNNGWVVRKDSGGSGYISFHSRESSTGNGPKLVLIFAPPPPPPAVVLNEIYPNPIGAAAAPNNREWIELYNNDVVPVDVSGWFISEMAGSNEAYKVINVCPGSAPGGTIAPYGTASTVIAPGGLLILQFCSASGFLDNGGDTVRLYTPDSILVDWHTYPATAAGKSHARFTDGGLPWIDPEPTPGEPNRFSRQDLIDAGFSDEQIEAMVALLAARGEYLLGEEPEELSGEPVEQDQESAEEYAKEEEGVAEEIEETGEDGTAVGEEESAGSTAEETEDAVETEEASEATEAAREEDAGDEGGGPDEDTGAATSDGPNDDA